MSLSILINGEARPLCAVSVFELLVRQGIDPAKRGVAVAINGEVVRRDQWQSTRLQANDSVEIVKPFAGG